jgi:hypothetical protein
LERGAQRLRLGVTPTRQLWGRVGRVLDHNQLVPGWYEAKQIRELVCAVNGQAKGVDNDAGHRSN